MIALTSFLVGFGVVSALAAQASSPAERDKAEVIAVVQKFFDALASHDEAALSATLLPDGLVRSMREDKGEWTLRTVSFGETVRSLSANPSRLLERMWDPDVRIYGRIATLAAPYDFHVDGAFSHCGTDLFQLVKNADGWRISGLLYTVQRSGCTPSPLGPPGGRKD